MYHRTVGRNCLLELDLTPDRNGLIPPSYAERYKELGDFIKSCYGNPKYSSHEEMGEEEGVYRLLFDEPTKIDRIVLMEDQAQGQVIRSYGVYGRVVKNDDDGEKGTGSGGGEEAPFSKLSNGTSIGHKKIDLFDGPVAVTEVMVNTTFVDTPRWRSVTVHLCD